MVYHGPRWTNPCWEPGMESLLLYIQQLAIRQISANEKHGAQFGCSGQVTAVKSLRKSLRCPIFSLADGNSDGTGHKKTWDSEASAEAGLN